MSKAKTQPVALTVAGSDSGGGAGIQADLKTFAALGVHGTCAIACITAQNPDQVSAIETVTPDLVRKQLDSVFATFRPGAVKTGMLYSPEIVSVVAGFFQPRSSLPLIVDPVMIATSGASLAGKRAVSVLKQKLLPMAALVTPNLDELRVLAEMELEEPEDLRRAARRVRERFGCAVLAKGGHLEGMREAMDLFYDGENEWLVSSPYRKGLVTHGTGCTYAAAIAGYLALGCKLPQAVQQAKEYISRAISLAVRVGRYTVLRYV